MSKRRYHVLAPNEASSRPTNHLFVDIESRLTKTSETTTEHRLWFGWAFHWMRRPDRSQDTVTEHRFTTEDTFWDLVTSFVWDGKPLYLVTHNVNYDLGVMNCFSALELRGFKLANIYLGGMTAIVKWTSPGGTLHVLDNANLFPGTLARLGDALGFPKMDVDPLTASEAEADPYCRRDAEIMLKAWQAYYNFLDEHDLGNWGKTTPAQAFNAYRHRFMPCDIHIHDKMDVIALEREAYHGGRTSIFYQGELTEGPYFYLDVNSMYPAVMEQHGYPVRAHRLQKQMTVERLQNALTRYGVIARVTVHTDCPVYMVKYKAHMVHPIGTFEAVLSTPELSYALEHGHILDVKEAVRYDMAPLFRSYVEFFYKLKASYKEAGQSAYYHMVKLFLNSLYGKFGQKSRSLEPYEPKDRDFSHMDHIIDADTGEIRHIYTFGSTRWIWTDEGEAYNSFPAIAAHVTAYARMLLWSYIERAGKTHVYYTDTDSVIVDRVGYDRLSGDLHESHLGALKVEQQAMAIRLDAPKCYQFGTVTKRKGVPRKATRTAPNSWQFEQFPSFRKQGVWDNETRYHTRTVEKTLSYKIHDGTVSPSGWVEPLQASTITDRKEMTSHEMEVLEQIDVQIEALKASQRVDAATVFRLWDHKKGDWRRVRNQHWELVPLEYGPADEWATELGFPDLAALKEAVTETLDLWAQVRTLRDERQAVMHGQEPEARNISFPF